MGPSSPQANCVLGDDSSMTDDGRPLIVVGDLQAVDARRRLGALNFPLLRFLDDPCSHILITAIENERAALTDSARKEMRARRKANAELRAIQKAART